MSVQKVDGKLEFSQSLGGLATGLSGYTERPGTKWIGWPGIASDGLSEAEKAHITKRLKRNRCYPVFLTQAQIDAYYNGFSNSVLWPLFHDLAVAPYPTAYWSAYKRVNKLFSDAVLGLSKPGSTVWVHDYQLLLVPDLLRRAGRGDKVGYFLHIPFPAAGKLGELAEAKPLLRGMLGADLVGFHTRSYVRNFVAGCDAVLGTGDVRDYIEIGGRTVRVTDFPMGIDYARFAKSIELPDSQKALRQLQREYRGRKVIITVDRLDPSKGLVERLRAYQTLLRQNPDLHGKVVMVMIVAPSRTNIPEYQALEQKLHKLVASIMNEFGSRTWQPLDFRYKAVPLETVMLYLQLADVAFITPLRDGMNLVAKEYLASKPDSTGVLVLSETAGAAEELRDAIQVNAARPSSLVAGLQRALTLPKRELQARASRMQHHVKHFTVQHWAADFIETLQRPQLPKPLVKALTPKRAEMLSSAYHRARNRLLLLDYDGTLSEFVKDPAAAKPTREVMRLLKRLSANRDNQVAIVSGRSRHDLAKWFGDLPIALAAEHGAFFRRRDGKHWHRTVQVDTEWQKPVNDLFSYYLDATPGAFIEQKNAAIVWHYRAASTFQAQKNLVAIRRLLKPLLQQYNLVAKEGHKILEVQPREISKGRAAQEWLIHDHDFVLAIGDDATDEDMFAALPASAYTIKVGTGISVARFRVKNVRATIDLLDKL